MWQKAGSKIYLRNEAKTKKQSLYVVSKTSKKIYSHEVKREANTIHAKVNQRSEFSLRDVANSGSNSIYVMSKKAKE
jgi:hypothetical protein